MIYKLAPDLIHKQYATVKKRVARIVDARAPDTSEGNVNDSFVRGVVVNHLPRVYIGAPWETATER